jgi:hypothetical protein
VRPLLALVTVALLSIEFAACGGTAKNTHRTAPAVSNSAAFGEASSSQDYLNDSDDEPSTDEDLDDRNGNKTDEDNDYREDHMHPENNRYHDSDDASVLDYGSEANAAELKAVTAVVERYYKLAAADNGAKACSMIDSSLAKSLPEDYGQSPGPAYLRGAKTCQAIMSLVFKYRHALVDAPIHVTGLLVKGDLAIALLGSKTLPAADITVKREHGRWQIDALLGTPLP